MARRRQKALTRDGIAVIATLLNWATMRHHKMHKNRWRTSCYAGCGKTKRSENWLQTFVDGEKPDQLLNWITIARDGGWWSTHEDSFFRRRLMPCKIKLPTRTDDVLMRYKDADADICDIQAKDMGENIPGNVSKRWCEQLW